MDFKGKKLGQIFVALGLLDENQEKAALGYSRQWGVPFGRACVKMGFLDEEIVVRALAAQVGAPSVSLNGIDVPPAVLQVVPVKFAERHRAVPIAILPGGSREGVRSPTPVSSAKSRNTLVLAVASQKDPHTIDELSFVTGCKLSLVIASDEEIDRALMRFYGVEVDRHTRSSYMVDLEEAAALQEGESGHSVSHDPLDFLPTVDVKK